MRGSRSKAQHDKVFVNCQYSMATFSTGERKRRPRGDRKSQEMTMHLRQTFEAAILTHLYPRSQIDIFVEVRKKSGDSLLVCVAKKHCYQNQTNNPRNILQTCALFPTYFQNYHMSTRYFLWVINSRHELHYKITLDCGIMR